MRLTDVGIATCKKGWVSSSQRTHFFQQQPVPCGVSQPLLCFFHSYKGFRGNCATSFIDQFKALHMCNKYCEILGLASLQPKPKKTFSAPKPKPQTSSAIPKKKTFGPTVKGKSWWWRITDQMSGTLRVLSVGSSRRPLPPTSEVSWWNWTSEWGLEPRVGIRIEWNLEKRRYRLRRTPLEKTTWLERESFCPNFFLSCWQLWIQRLIFDFSQRLRDRFVSGIETQISLYMNHREVLLYAELKGFLREPDSE